MDHMTKPQRLDRKDQSSVKSAIVVCQIKKLLRNEYIFLM